LTFHAGKRQIAISKKVRRMIGLLQKVTHAEVVVDGNQIASINEGLMVLVGVEKTDTADQAARLMERLLTYRVFPDDSGRMNLSLKDTGGGLLLVPQFTLAADTKKGTRASFTSAANPEDGERLFGHLVRLATDRHPIVETGQFAAHMEITMTNDGPVTFWLRAAPGV
jgi:D-tyrosyl-tRNA(Tyr) deacylase